MGPGHRADRGVSQAHHGPHHHVECPLLSFDVVDRERPMQSEAGVVDEQVEWLVVKTGLDVSRLLQVGQVGRQGLGMDPVGEGDLVRHLLESRLVARDKHQVVSPGSECVAEGAADARGRSGDKRKRHRVSIATSVVQCKRRLIDTSTVLPVAWRGAYDVDVSHSHQTGHRTSPAPLRVLAVVGAVLVTLLAVGGALGFVPGARAEASPQTQHLAAPGFDGDTGTSATPPGSDPPGAGISSGGSPSPWLKIDSQTGSHKGDQAGNTHHHASPKSRTGDAETTSLPPGSGQGRRVVYDISAQRVWLVDDDGGSQRTYLVSGARNEQLLDPGSYHVSSKSLHAISFDHKATMDFMVRFAQGEHSAIGFHDVPALPDGSLAQSRADLGTPTSAGCIRQWRPDAKALWRFTEVGSLVVVTA